MTTIVNPFASDPERASAFELGFIAGFHDPAGDVSDFVPLEAELLDIYVQGADAGREAAHAGPGADPSKQWLSRDELRAHSADEDELIEHIATSKLFKEIEMLTGKSSFGLVELVILALGIQGNFTPEQLRPLDDDFVEPPNEPAPEAVRYVAACMRTDHALVSADVAPDGKWTGPARELFGDALTDAIRHEHREALIARCDTDARTCSCVWLAKDRN